MDSLTQDLPTPQSLMGARLFSAERSWRKSNSVKAFHRTTSTIDYFPAKRAKWREFQTLPDSFHPNSRHFARFAGTPRPFIQNAIARGQARRCGGRMNRFLPRAALAVLFTLLAGATRAATYTPEQIAAYNKMSAGFRTSLRGIGKPTIAMIRGWCLGGGLAIALNCDLRICSEDAQFGVPAAKLGIGYGAEPQRIGRDDGRG